MRRASIFLASLFLVASGCSLYESNKPPPQCEYPGGAGAATQNVRNPQSGQCVSLSTGGSCDPQCGPCTSSSPPSNVMWTWGMCVSQCTGLAENACLATPGCRAAYIDPCSNGGCPAGAGRQGPRYYGCWATDRTGPIEGGGCKGLDAEACSKHDDCAAIHDSACADGTFPADPTTCGIGDFERCAEERPHGCASDADCATGSYCDTSDCPKCNSAGCETCYGTCAPDWPPPTLPPACSTLTNEASCIGRTDCTPIYQGVDCSCDASGACTCQKWVFSSCEAAGGSGTTADGGSAPTGTTTVPPNTTY